MDTTNPASAAPAKTVHEHFKELHGHNLNAQKTFHALNDAVAGDTALHPTPQVRKALDAHRKALATAVEQSQNKVNASAPAETTPKTDAAKGAADTSDD